MAPYRYKFIPEDRQSEGTDSTGYPPWLYGLEKIYLQRKSMQREKIIKSRSESTEIIAQWIWACF